MLDKLNKWMRKYVSENVEGLNENVIPASRQLGSLYHTIAIKKDKIDWHQQDPYEDGWKFEDLEQLPGSSFLYDKHRKASPIFTKIMIGYTACSRMENYKQFKNIIAPYFTGLISSLKDKGLNPETSLMGQHFLKVIEKPKTKELIFELENSADFAFLISSDCVPTNVFCGKKKE